MGADPPADEVGRATFASLARLDEDRGRLYADLLLVCLTDATRRLLESLMNQDWVPQSDYSRRHYDRGLAEGKAEGEARGLLALLEVRGLTPTASDLERIHACADPATLDRWIERAKTSPS